jgi:hypothetical protein
MEWISKLRYFHTLKSWEALNQDELQLKQINLINLNNTASERIKSVLHTLIQKQEKMKHNSSGKIY